MTSCSLDVHEDVLIEHGDEPGQVVRRVVEADRSRPRRPSYRGGSTRRHHDQSPFVLQSATMPRKKAKPTRIVKLDYGSAHTEKARYASL